MWGLWWLLVDNQLPAPTVAEEEAAMADHAV